MKMKKIALLAMLVAMSGATGAMAMKFSDSDRVKKAVEAIAMADALAAGTPQTINCRIDMAASGAGPGARGATVQPEVVLQSGQQAFTNLLAAMTTKITND
jgi:hypothetical protein